MVPTGDSAGNADGGERDLQAAASRRLGTMACPHAGPREERGSLPHVQITHRTETHVDLCVVRRRDQK